jgi:hypothetical protein
MAKNRSTPKFWQRQGWRTEKGKALDKQRRRSTSRLHESGMLYSSDVPRRVPYITTKPLFLTGKAAKA